MDAESFHPTVVHDKEGHEQIIVDEDESKLASLGKKRKRPGDVTFLTIEQMARNFNIISMLGMCFCIIATVFALLLSHSSGKHFRRY